MGVRKELGIVSQRLRADAAALKFRNNILSLGDEHLVKRVYVGLRAESGRLGTGSMKNGVRGYLEKLAVEANWSNMIVGKQAAKQKAKKFVVAKQVRLFSDELKTKSTLAEYVGLIKDGIGLPMYLRRTCPFGLRHGRRLKTKFRLGAHQLQGSLARLVPRRDRTAAHSRCQCCSAGVDETVRHALFECGCHDDIRRDFYERVDDVHPAFGPMHLDEKFRLLMSDDTPREVDSLLYRFLIQLFASRERRLA